MVVGRFFHTPLYVVNAFVYGCASRKSITYSAPDVHNLHWICLK